MLFYEPEPASGPEIIGDTAVKITDDIVAQHAAHIPQTSTVSYYDDEINDGFTQYHTEDYDTDDIIPLADYSDIAIEEPGDEIIDKAADESMPQNAGSTAEQQPEVTTTVKEPFLKEKEATRPSGKRGRMSFKEMDAELVMVDVPDDDILFKNNITAWVRSRNGFT